VSNEEASHVGKITRRLQPCATVSSREKRPLESALRRVAIQAAGVLQTWCAGSPLRERQCAADNAPGESPRALSRTVAGFGLTTAASGLPEPVVAAEGVRRLPAPKCTVERGSTDMVVSRRACGLR
jgi:hypothetical protein